MSAKQHPEVLSLLKAHALSVTDGRKEILGLFLARKGALAHADIEKKVGDRFDRVTIYRTLQAFVDTGLVHSCFYGMSAVYPPKNGLGSEGDREVVEKYGKIVDVPCITFKTLLEKHNITSFDVLKIDAEGHDYQIFNQLDLNKFRPKLIRLEWVNLNDEQKQNILTSFEVHKYYHEFVGQDITASPLEIVDDLNSNNVTQVIEKIEPNNSGVTLVTGLWNIKRDTLSEGWSRSFDHYLEKFKQLLLLNI